MTQENSTQKPSDSGEKSKKKEEITYCPECGYKLSPNTQECPECNFDLSDYTIRQREKSSLKEIETPYYNKPTKEQTKVSNEGLYSQDKELWSTSASILIPIGAFILMNVLLGIGLGTVIIFFQNNESLPNIANNPIIFLISIIGEIIFLLIPLKYVGKYLEEESISNRFKILGLEVERTGFGGALKEVLIGVVFAFIALLSVAGVTQLMYLILSIIFDADLVNNVTLPMNEFETAISGIELAYLITIIVLMFLIIGPSEEILFRGFMQKGLVRSIGKKSGMLVTALIFGSIHIITVFIYLLQPVLFLVAFSLSFFPYLAISLLLGILFYYRDENLIAPIVTHGLYNSILIIISFLL